MTWDDYVKDFSKANRGRDFEDFINFANGKYQAEGVACMHKVPTEFIPLRGPRGNVTGCKVNRKSCVDYLGHFQGIPVAVEAKHTGAKRIEFSAVQKHQAEYLDDWTRTDGGQMAFICVSFDLNRFYMVPWRFWKAGMKSWELYKQTGKKEIVTVEQYGWTWITPGKASVSVKDLLPDWEIRAGGRYGLPYLQIIEKIAGGIKENEDTRPGY